MTDSITLDRLQTVCLVVCISAGIVVVRKIWNHPDWHCPNQIQLRSVLLLGYVYGIISICYLKLFDFNIIVCNYTILPVLFEVFTFFANLLMIDWLTVALIGQNHSFLHKYRLTTSRRAALKIGISLFLVLSFAEHFNNNHNLVYSGSYYTVLCSESWTFSLWRHAVEYIIYLPLVQVYFSCSLQNFRNKYWKDINSIPQLDWSQHGCLLPKKPCLCSQLQSAVAFVYNGICVLLFLVRPLVILFCLVTVRPYYDLLLGMSICSAELFLCFEILLTIDLKSESDSLSQIKMTAVGNV